MCYVSLYTEIREELLNDSEFLTLCRQLPELGHVIDRGTELITDSEYLAISILITFIVTAAVVVFLDITLGLVLSKCTKKEGRSSPHQMDTRHLKRRLYCFKLLYHSYSKLYKCITASLSFMSIYIFSIFY